MKTFEEVGTMVDDYFLVPHIQKLKDILIATEPLDNVEKADIVRRLAHGKPIHGMGERALNAELKDLSAKKVAVDGGSVSDAFYEDGKFRPMLLTKHLMEVDHYIFSVEDEMLRVYQDGVYVADEVRDTERLIEKLLGSAVKTHQVAATMKLLQDQNAQKITRHPDWINLKNGRYCLHSGAVLSHQPEFKSVIQLPVEYDSRAECPAFDKWIRDVLPNADNQYLLLQLIGYSMLQDVRFGKIVVLYGPTHTGKSTCLDLVKAFLGGINVSAVSLHALDNEDMRFARSQIAGKLANLSADLSSKHLAGDSQVKQIASGDSMTVEHKGVKPFTISPFATLWNSSNQLPVSNDRTDAWYERLVILPFMQQHKGEKADREILDKLTQPSEMSGILNKVLEALQVLLDENQFRTTESTDEMLMEYRTHNDQVNRYLSERCVKVEDGEIREDTIYQDYEEWAASEGIPRPLPKTKFREGAKQWGATHKFAKREGNRYHAYEGIDFYATVPEITDFE